MSVRVLQKGKKRTRGAKRAQRKSTAAFVSTGPPRTVLMLTYLFPPSFSGGTRQALELAKACDNRA